MHSQGPARASERSLVGLNGAVSKCNCNRFDCSKEVLAEWRRRRYCCIDLEADESKCHPKADPLPKHIASISRLPKFQVIANFESHNDSNGIVVPVANRETRPSFKQKYQQQTVDGQPVRTLNELYAAAEISLPVFQERVQKVVGLARERLDVPDSDVTIKIPKLKTRDLSNNKAEDDYSNQDPGPGISWLFDIVRANIEFTSAAQVRACLEILQEDESIHIVKAKNRFQEPTLSGYRNLNIQFRIDTQKDSFIFASCKFITKQFSSWTRN